ncbi:MAG: hypothetical protein VX544_04555 [Pseudomonadota bacterium]|nr:hypothetical protein [Pseudomonadota bacterium]
MTKDIIKFAVCHFVNNIKDYLYIVAPSLIFSVLLFTSIASAAPDPVNLLAPYTTFHNFILLLAMIFFSLLSVVNIHRFVILGETNFYAFNTRWIPVLKYFLIALAITLLGYVPYLPSAILIVTGNDVAMGLGYLLIRPAFVMMFLILIFLMLHLPASAIGEKIPFFGLWKLSKGFRLTVFLQLLIATLLTSVVGIIQILFSGGLYYDVNWTIFYIEFAINFTVYVVFVTCLSRTFMLFKEKNLK